MSPKYWFLILIGSALIPVASAQTTDSWTNTPAGTFKWETGSAWSLGVPPSTSQSSIMITNRSVAGARQNRQKTVEIDSTTAGSFPGSMLINNLTVLAPTGDQNTLLLSNTGSAALTIVNTLSISSQGVLQVTGSSLLFSTTNTSFILDDGTVVLENGTISVAETMVGYMGQGTWEMNGGTWQCADDLYVGDLSGSSGTLTITGGTDRTTLFEPALC
jgi:hypothetical protein